MGWNSYKIPLIGKELAKVGKVYQILNMPCVPTPEMWVLAFWYGIPRLMWMLYKPDALDFEWSRVGRRRGIKRRQKVTFEDYVSDETAIDIGPSLRWVRFAGDWAQRVGWWLLIVDAAIDLSVYWTSAAYGFAGCMVPGNPYVQGSAQTGFAVGPTPNWTRAGPVLVDHAVWPAGGLGDFIIPAGYGFSAAYSTGTIPWLGHYAPLGGIRLRNITSGEIVSQTNLIGKGPQRSAGGLVHQQPLLSLTDQHYIFEWISAGGDYTQEGPCSITVTGAGVPIGLTQGDP